MAGKAGVKNFNGLTTLNLELTSRCNKNCWMCGRRKIDRDYAELSWQYGDMDFSLVKSIARQLPAGIVVQFHDNGEPLLYPQFGRAVSLFKEQIRCMDTNGKLIVEKAEEIIGKLDTLTISVFQDDPEQDSQYRKIRKFLKLRKDKKPNVIIRCLGGVNIEKYKKLDCIIATRILHSSLGSFQYKKKSPTIPEIGICLDLLNHMVIHREGSVSVCVRFDPLRLGVIGNAADTPLVKIWNSGLRKSWIERHIKGQRSKVPLCSYCEFWGVPTGY